MSHLTLVDRRLLLTGATLTAAGVAGPAAAHRRGRRRPDDFATLEGGWRVVHRRLLRPLDGDGGWVRHEGDCVVTPILGGLGAVDDHRLVTPRGNVGRASFRIFDPARSQWSTWAVDGSSGQLGPRLIGRRIGPVAVFYGADRFHGRPVDVRIRWSGLDEAPLRCEEAFSTDQGMSWQTFQVMEFMRLA